MSADRVLILFANPHGSTARVAETIAVELRDAGFAVDCLPVAEISDLEPYGAFVIGSGVFLARRSSDGGGFIERHAEALARRPVWLFSAGPIGGAHGHADGAPAPEARVVQVARAIGARGAATFGAARMSEANGHGGPPSADWAEAARVRGWAWSIAVELGRTGSMCPTPLPERPRPPAPARRFPGPAIGVTR